VRIGIALVALAGLLCGCAMQSSGEAAQGISERAIASAYIPLSGSEDFLLEGHGAAVVIAPGIAVTNAHNANLLPNGTDVIGTSHDFDLLFFRTRNMSPPPIGEPSPTERIVAYGQGSGGDLRKAIGVVKWRLAPVLPRCPKCPEQKAFAYEANAGAGFSGGPVIDAQTGALLGITFGYNDEENGGIEKLMYAYDLKTVLGELARLENGGKSTP